MEYEKYQERIAGERAVIDAFMQVSCVALERHDLKPVTDMGVLAVAQAHTELLNLADKKPEISFNLLKEVLYAIATAPELGYSGFKTDRDVIMSVTRAHHLGYFKGHQISPHGRDTLERHLQNRSSIA